MQGVDVLGPFGEGSRIETAIPFDLAVEDKRVEEHDVSDEEEPLLQTMKCRICQEDHIKNLGTPCARGGSLKVSFL
uniref:Uncharacterized protein n=1 Tax=Nelumbo nucifera TaxID=4432 RepID=A0A822YDP3_NELNU|nr:TPA_asm: hypothetical protein HUJ06_011125 [Nelumbo nucifera]